MTFYREDGRRGVFSEKNAFDVEVVRLPKMNVPKIGVRCSTSIRLKTKLCLAGEAKGLDTTSS